MAVQKALDVAEPPHETNGDANLREVYEGAEFYDDVTGVLLDWPSRRGRWRSSSSRQEACTRSAAENLGCMSSPLSGLT